MGTVVEARCTCGYRERAVIGAGMRGHDIMAGWPVLCGDCQAVTGTNTKASPLTCLMCNGTNVVLYVEGPLMHSGSSVAPWGDLTMTDGAALCPKCRTFGMRFGRRGPMFD